MLLGGAKTRTQHGCPAGLLTGTSAPHVEIWSWVAIRDGSSVIILMITSALVESKMACTLEVSEFVGQSFLFVRTAFVLRAQRGDRPVIVAACGGCGSIIIGCRVLFQHRRVFLY